MKPTVIDFQSMSGDSLTLKIKMVDSARAPYDVSWATVIKWKLARKNTDTVYLIEKALTAGVAVIHDMGPPEAYYITVDLVENDSKDLSGDFYHECELRDGSGKVVTAFIGTGTFIKDLITS